MFMLRPEGTGTSSSNNVNENCLVVGGFTVGAVVTLCPYYRC